MLRMIAVALLATGMSVGFAEAKGHKAATLAPCQTEAQATAKCACGPAKKTCNKGEWCHAFAGACSK